MTWLTSLLRRAAPAPDHEWETKRTYELPGPRPNPEVTVRECVHCGLVKETSRWHDPNPQYFERDTRAAPRVAKSDVLSGCDR